MLTFYAQKSVPKSKNLKDNATKCCILEYNNIKYEKNVILYFTNIYKYYNIKTSKTFL